MVDHSRVHHPRILKKGAIDALNNLAAAIELLGCKGDATYWIKRYRERNSASAVPWYGIYPELSVYVTDLDKAFFALHTYKHEDYISQAGAASVRKTTGRLGGQKKVVPDEVILQWLIDVGYAISKNKKALQIEAEEKFGIKKSRLLAVAKANRLTRQPKQKPPSD